MTTDSTAVPAAHPADAPVNHGLGRLVEELREVPLRFVLLACVASALVLFGAWTTPVERYFHPDDPVMAFVGGLWRLGDVLLVLAPLMALRWPPVATAMPLVAVVPVVLFGQHAWPFVAILSLLAVAMVSMWRRPAWAVGAAAVALSGIAVLLAGVSVMVMPFGAEISFEYTAGWERLLTLGMYAVVALLALGVARWMRADAMTARRAAVLEARSGAVEERASVIEERARLARDLHDVVAHHVSLIAVRAETAPYTHPGLPPEARELLDDIAADARRALDELRGVLGVLRRAEDTAPSRAPQPQLADAAELVEAARAAGETVQVSGLDVAAGSPQQYVAYRLVQEALTNARRHAPGRPVTVAVLGEDAVLRVRVTTPYSGVQPSSSGAAGHGLAGMRERVEALGGTLDAGVRDDSFVVEAVLPRGLS